MVVTGRCDAQHDDQNSVGGVHQRFNRAEARTVTIA